MDFILKKKWSDLDKATFSFGYGLMVTPLQLCRAYAIIGSYGNIKPLSILKVKNKIFGKRIFPKKIVKMVINMMEHISINLNNTNYKIAVKTGTVKKIGKKGYYIDKYISYAVGILPVDYPRFSIIVMINNPKSGRYYGRTVSMPVLKKISQQILSINKYSK